jgi:hypothetical protein
MIGPSGMRYEVTIRQCVSNFFRGLAGVRVCYGAREYSNWYNDGDRISCALFLAALTSPLWVVGMLIGFFLGRLL